VFVETPPVLVPPPVVTNVRPGSGPAAGGTAVMIEGENLEAAQSVSFGGVPAASFKSRSATEVEAVTPPGSPGDVDVLVTTASGTSAVSSSDRFIYDSGDSGGKGGGSGQGKSGATASGGVAGSTSSVAPTCNVSLRKKRLAVTRYRTVALRLVRSGSGPCMGKLALSYAIRAKRRGYTLRTIGTASFSVPGVSSKVVNVTLTSSGRAWFRSRHGKANASIAIARLVPAPLSVSTASVRLSLKKTAKRRPKK
jgi:hypothetical protein